MINHNHFRKIRAIVLKLIFSIILVLLFLILPLLIPNTYFIHLLILSMIYSILAMSWDILAGYTGLVSFGHAAFFSIGGYSAALICIYLNVFFPMDILIGAVIASIIGVGIGIITLRLRGPYFAIATLGLSEIIRLIINNNEEVTRGPLGLSVPPFPFTKQIISISLLYRMYSFYVICITFIISVILMDKLTRSNLGLAFKAIRDDEDAAKRIGINITKYKLISFIISTFFAGLIGGLYAHYIMLITPEMGGLDNTFLVIAMSIFGGVGTLYGSILGAFLFVFLSEYLRILYLYRYIVFGIIIAFTIILMPRGIFGYRKKIKEFISRSIHI